ncbi:hypothetical protein CR513_34177, partial [Mucuna pruriens]
MLPCSLSERVCHSAPEGGENFIYQCKYIMKTLGVGFPLPSFETDVLQILGVAPSQLHPTSWAALRVFQSLCRLLFFYPPASLFLYYYTPRVSEKVSWVLFVPRSNRPFLNEHVIPLPHFRHEFVKLKTTTNVPFSYDTKSFIFYWRAPNSFADFRKGNLTSDDQVFLSFLEKLPTNLSCETILRLRTESGAHTLLKKYLAEQGCDIDPLFSRPRAHLKARTYGSPTNSPRTHQKKVKRICSPSASVSDPTVSPLPISSNVPGSSKLAPVDHFLLTDLASFIAPPKTNSLWHPNLEMSQLVPPNLVTPHDQTLLSSSNMQTSFDMMLTYHARSIVALDVWREKLAHLDQSRARAELREEKYQHLLEEHARVKKNLMFAEIEVTALKARAVELQRDSDLTKKDLDHLRIWVVQQEGRIESKTAHNKQLSDALDIAWDERKIAEQKALQTALDQAESRARNESLMTELARGEEAVQKAREVGFLKTLRQISILAPRLDVNQVSIHKDIINGKRMKRNVRVNVRILRPLLPHLPLGDKALNNGDES